MSDENVAAFRRGIDASNRGDVEALLNELDPDIEWHSAMHALLGGEETVFRGHDRVRGKTSGAVSVTPIALVTEVRNGKARLLRTYRDADEAREAAGLR